MKFYVHRFKVEGRGVFPLDMLRHDHCYPADTVSAVAIGPTSDRSQVREVELVHVGPHRWSPTYERWTSFGWSVVGETERPRYGVDSRPYL